MAITVSTARDALDSATAAFAAAGCDSPRLDAELLLAAALGIDRASLLADSGVGIGPAEARRFADSVRRRVGREPVAYILGVKGFRHIDLMVDSRVLIPRPESELLVELAVALPAGARVHDVGTGSGAIALAIASERPDLKVSASDAHDPALDVARMNAERLGLTLELSLESGLPDTAQEADLVVANLPYVSDSELAILQPEIQLYEPSSALVGGADGLEPIRDLVAGAPSGMRLALEHAPAQAVEVRSLLDDASTHRDLAGRERVTEGRVR